MSDIHSERRDSTALITLDNPEAFNALTPTMTSGLVSALREAAADRTCRTIVLTGRGERAFCAGVDVKSVAQRDADAGTRTGSSADPIEAQFQNLHHELAAIIRTIHTLPVPVIAAVNGHAIGGGFAIAAASDLRVASDNAAFTDGFVGRGISGCELGLSYFLPHLVGASTAFDWMLTGRRVYADEALSSGLVRRVVPVSEVVDAALEIGAQIAELAPMAVTMTKETMWANLQAPSLDHTLAFESRTQVMTRNTGDAAEARRAFLEKRAPVFGTPDVSRPVR
jgi:enoyl-CoA hydratase